MIYGVKSSNTNRVDLPLSVKWKTLLRVHSKAVSVECLWQ